MSRIRSSFGLALTVLAAACADQPAPDEATPDAAPADPAARAEVPLFSVDVPGAGTVAWLPPELPGDEPVISITGQYPDPPPVDPALGETLDPFDLYLAVAPPGAEIPAALRVYASATQADRLADPDRRVRLHAKNQAALATWSYAEDTADVYVAGCSAAHRAWFRSWYGPGYARTNTCGDNTGFTTAVGHYYYCNEGEDCDYPLPGLQECWPAADGCTTVRGDLDTHRTRSWPGAGYDADFGVNGHRYAFGLTTCPDSSGSVNMERKRGNSDWIVTPVAVGTGSKRVGGRDHMPDTSSAQDSVTWGIWKNHVPRSGSTYQLNSMKVSTTPGEYTILCADVQQEFETFDATYVGCNWTGSTHLGLCEDTPCDGSCWDDVPGY